MKPSKIIRLLKGGAGSGRHKELVNLAEQESQRLSRIGDGKSVHKRANIRMKLEGLAHLLQNCKEEAKLGKYLEGLKESLREASVIKSKKEALRDWIRNG